MSAVFYTCLTVSGKQQVAVATENGQATQPAVYYAVATSDILRQLQAAHPNQTDMVVRPQLVQTPSGLVLLHQAPACTAPANPVGSKSPQTQSAAVGAAVAARSVATSSTTESATLPRPTRTESGLICTCPPEVHQGNFVIVYLFHSIGRSLA